MIETRTNFCTLSVNQTDAASLIDLTKVHSLAENVLFEEKVYYRKMLL